MNKTNRNFIEMTTKAIQEHVLICISHTGFESHNAEINQCFRRLKRTARRYNRSSNKSKKELWSMLFTQLDNCFRNEGIEDAPEDEAIATMMAIASCILIANESEEFSRLFIEKQTEWGVTIIPSSNRDGHTIH